MVVVAINRNGTRSHIDTSLDPDLAGHVNSRRERHKVLESNVMPDRAVEVDLRMLADAYVRSQDATSADDRPSTKGCEPLIVLHGPMDQGRATPETSAVSLNCKTFT
jgi:hypothetical protein